MSEWPSPGMERAVVTVDENRHNDRNVADGKKSDVSLTFPSSVEMVVCHVVCRRTAVGVPIVSKRKERKDERKSRARYIPNVHACESRASSNTATVNI